MKILTFIKRINFASFWKLVTLCIKNPLLVLPTYNATKDCLDAATLHFGKKHYQNGPANAFRHAYWNYLIAKYCTNRSKDNIEVLDWTKKITDWHENAFKNRTLARIMDFHNNAIGRKVFIENQETTITNVCELLLQMTKASVKICSKLEMENNSLNLVYITDDQ